MRRSSTERLDELDVLGQMLLRGGLIDSEEAVKRLIRQDKLGVVAVSKLEDQDGLCRVAIGARCEQTRRAAVEKVRRVDVL